MNWQNRYYRAAIIGAAATFILQTILALTADLYLASVLTPLYPVWIIVFVVGWRKEHPRR